jgi:hypothetical protein
MLNHMGHTIPYWRAFGRDFDIHISIRQVCLSAQPDQCSDLRVYDNRQSVWVCEWSDWRHHTQWRNLGWTRTEPHSGPVWEVPVWSRRPFRRYTGQCHRFRDWQFDGNSRFTVRRRYFPPAAVSVDASGRFAYVVNRDSNTVSAYSINPSTGALTPLATPDFATGAAPVSVTTTSKIQ